MATRQVLADLVTRLRTSHRGDRCGSSRWAVWMPPSGWRRARHFDVVVLASDAIDKLHRRRSSAAGSRVDLVHSGVAVAVKAGAALPDLSSEEAVRDAVLAAAADWLLHRAQRHGVDQAVSTLGHCRSAAASGWCRHAQACRWRRWWPAARWRWAFSSSANCWTCEGIQVVGPSARCASRSPPPFPPACPCGPWRPGARRCARLLEFHALARGRRRQAPPRHGASLTLHCFDKDLS